MQELLDLVETIKTMEGLLSVEVTPGEWFDGEENQEVMLIIIEHEFASFNDPIYDELMELFPENTDEFDRDEEVYTSTFVVV
jgi:hypothetical protein